MILKYLNQVFPNDPIIRINYKYNLLLHPLFYHNEKCSGEKELLISNINPKREQEISSYLPLVYDDLLLQGKIKDIEYYKERLGSIASISARLEYINPSMPNRYYRISELHHKIRVSKLLSKMPPQLLISRGIFNAEKYILKSEDEIKLYQEIQDLTSEIKRLYSVSGVTVFETRLT